MRIIKFRVWDTKNKKFLKAIPPEECMLDSDEWDHRDADGDGEGCLTFPATVCQQNFGGRLVWQQFTGLKDKNDKDVFSGDIIKFKYTVGDFAYENMAEDEVKENEAMSGQVFTGAVVWHELSAGFFIIVGDERSTHTRFPMLYANFGKVIGNIFENPEMSYERT